MSNTAVCERKETPVTHTRRCREMVPADIYEGEDRYEIHLDMPGVATDAVRVEVNRDRLEVEGLRHIDDLELHYERNFEIGDAVNTEEITGSLNNGVLRLVLPKAAEHRPRRISIQ